MTAEIRTDNAAQSKFSTLSTNPSGKIPRGDGEKRVLSQAERQKAEILLSIMPRDVDIKAEKLATVLNRNRTYKFPLVAVSKRMSDARLLAEEQGDTVLNVTLGHNRMATYRYTSREAALEWQETRAREVAEARAERERTRVRPRKDKERPPSKLELIQQALSDLNEASAADTLTIGKTVYKNEDLSDDVLLKRTWGLIRWLKQNHSGEVKTVVRDGKTFYYGSEGENSERGFFLEDAQGNPKFYLTTRGAKRDENLPTVILTPASLALMKKFSWTTYTTRASLLGQPTESLRVRVAQRVSQEINRARQAIAGTGIDIGMVGNDNRTSSIFYVFTEAKPELRLFSSDEARIASLLLEQASRKQIIESNLLGIPVIAPATLSEKIGAIEAKLVNYFVTVEYKRGKNEQYYRLVHALSGQPIDEELQANIQRLINDSNEYNRTHEGLVRAPSVRSHPLEHSNQQGKTELSYRSGNQIVLTENKATKVVNPISPLELVGEQFKMAEGMAIEETTEPDNLQSQYEGVIFDQILPDREQETLESLDKIVTSPALAQSVAMRLLRERGIMDREDFELVFLKTPQAYRQVIIDMVFDSLKKLSNITLGSKQDSLQWINEEI